MSQGVVPSHLIIAVESLRHKLICCFFTARLVPGVIIVHLCVCTLYLTPDPPGGTVTCLHGAICLCWAAVCGRRQEHGLSQAGRCSFSKSQLMGNSLLLILIPIVVRMLLLLAGDVERNPGPSRKLCNIVCKSTLWVSANCWLLPRLEVQL